MKTQKGFTLIELLVVIAIIGILSSIIMSGVNQARSRARDSERRQAMIAIQTALEMYHFDNGAYPNTNFLEATKTSGAEFLEVFLARLVIFQTWPQPSFQFYPLTHLGNLEDVMDTCIFPMVLTISCYLTKLVQKVFPRLETNFMIR